MSAAILVSGPVAGQSPYVYTDDDLWLPRQVLHDHFRQLVVGGPEVCGFCGWDWGDEGCPEFREAVAFGTVTNVEMEWRAVELPDIQFDFDADATQILHIAPAVFDEPRKPSPYPRQLVGAAA